MGSIRKLSNFNFQWTKTLLQNILGYITFFFLQFSRALDILVICINTKETLLMAARESKFHRNWEDAVKIVMHKISFCVIWSLWSLFSQVPITTFSLKLFHITVNFLVQSLCPAEKKIAKFPNGFRFDIITSNCTSSHIFMSN